MLVYLHFWYIPLLNYDAKARRNPGEYCDTIRGTFWYEQLAIIITAFITSFLVYSSYTLLAFTAQYCWRNQTNSLR
ncbi:hypothetical protein RvY_01583 [Ramazzottius varieornatus]|uniref:Uncharacterized protein n=1 Tax=Ramazzottius varieornatus TaxID=947166 RepID=A0A1D1UGW4_RAMVA|nr:hypothetical protein RvY_01583 [Ramazzottius varieornatus]